MKLVITIQAYTAERYSVVILLLLTPLVLVLGGIARDRANLGSVSGVIAEIHQNHLNFEGLLVRFHVSVGEMTSVMGYAACCRHVKVGRQTNKGCRFSRTRPQLQLADLPMAHFKLASRNLPTMIHACAAVTRACSFPGPPH